jgi:hypothetical protein
MSELDMRVAATAQRSWDIFNDQDRFRIAILALDERLDNVERVCFSPRHGRP